MTYKYIILIILTILPVLAFSAGYEVIHGKGIDVCEAYKNNLNSTRPKLPMECIRKINLDDKNFSKPVKERLDFSQGIMEYLDEFLWERDANPIYYTTDKSWEGTEAQLLEAKQRYLDNRNSRFWIGHNVTETDIDNDGKVEKVYIDQPCGSVYGGVMLILKDDLTDIDYEKSKIVLQHPSRKEAGWSEYIAVKEGDWAVSPSSIAKGYMNHPDSLHHAHYDIFKYKNNTYFDLWWSSHPDYKGKSPIHVGKLHVFFAEGKNVSEICTLKFNFK